MRFQSLEKPGRTLFVLAGPFLLFLAIAGSSLAIAKPSDAERLERKSFMERADQDKWERIQEAVNRMAEKGIHLKMEVREPLRPFADWDYFVVYRGEIRWTPNADQKYEEVVVPEGFVTDLGGAQK